MNLRPSVRLLPLLLLVVAAPLARAWDYEGHRLVNQLALAGLPSDFPDFVQNPSAAERIAFLAGEPDRWKNVADLPLRHENNPDHYLDLEQLGWAGLDPATVSPLRYQFALAFAAGRATHPDTFPAIDPLKDVDHTREWPGFLPWTIAEYFGRLKSAFSYLRAYAQGGGTATEIANAQSNIIYLMGVMGHFVGDGAQPLHDTVNHNGWVEANPHGYTTDSRFHAWIDGGFIARAGIRINTLLPRARPAQVLPVAASAGATDPMFANVMRYLVAQNARVAPLYALEKAGKLKGDGSPGDAEGRAFIEEQLLRGGEMLGSIWLTAYRTAPPDEFLLNQLARRAAAKAKGGG